MQIKINMHVIRHRPGWPEPGAGHHWRWWMTLYQPPGPYDANIYYHLIWATIYLSCTWSIKMNRTVVRIDCNFLSFSSTKVRFWHEDGILSALPLQLKKCNLSDQPHSICGEVLIHQWAKGHQKAICLLRYCSFRLPAPYHMHHIQDFPVLFCTAWLKLFLGDFFFFFQRKNKSSYQFITNNVRNFQNATLAVKWAIWRWHWQHSYMLTNTFLYGKS